MKRKRVLFCNIAWMDYYKGIVKGIDEPKSSHGYVKETGDAHEKYNFDAVYMDEESDYMQGEYCLGFVETKSTNRKTRNQMHIEKIKGCELLKNEDEAEDVLVIFCAQYPYTLKRETYVVGWYNHATVYRWYKIKEFDGEIEGEIYNQSYNVIAKKEDCVLLPSSIRRKSNIWSVPRTQNKISYGLGQSDVWYAKDIDENDNLKKYCDRIIKQIEEYDGENWIDMRAEEQ